MRNQIVYNGVNFTEPDFINCSVNRSKTSNAIKKGIIIKQSCESCGSNETIAHHENYSDYLNVRWLCRMCHSTIHHIFIQMNSNAKSKNTKTKTSSNRINFQELITNSGQPLTKAQLARDMVANGLFKNQVSAYNIIQYHERGEAKSIDYELLQYLMNRFNLTSNQIIK